MGRGWDPGLEEREAEVVTMAKWKGGGARDHQRWGSWRWGAEETPLPSRRSVCPPCFSYPGTDGFMFSDLSVILTNCET